MSLKPKVPGFQTPLREAGFPFCGRAGMLGRGLGVLGSSNVCASSYACAGRRGSSNVSASLYACIGMPSRGDVCWPGTYTWFVVPWLPSWSRFPDTGPCAMASFSIAWTMEKNCLRRAGGDGKVVGGRVDGQHRPYHLLPTEGATTFPSLSPSSAK